MIISANIKQCLRHTRHPPIWSLPQPEEAGAIIFLQMGKLRHRLGNLLGITQCVAEPGFSSGAWVCSLGIGFRSVGITVSVLQRTGQAVLIFHTEGQLTF